MKRLVTLLMSLMIICQTFSQAPTFPDLGTCNPTSNNLPAPQNGNGVLGQIYNFSKCGLNYVQATQRLGRRGSLNGVPQPATYTITGLPACYVIERAYIWASMSGTAVPFNVTVTNPAMVPFVYAAATVGTGPDKCWGYGGSSSYRIDVTSCITGNGNYIISGFPTNPPTPQKDTDGATLFIIYSDPTANYQGSMVIHDGCVVGIGGNTAQTLTGINACANSIYARAFCMTGDWQLNGITGVWNGSPINIPWNWWNYNEIPTNVVAAQVNANYTHAGLNDCYNWVVMGLYYRTNTCTTCPQNTALTITPSSNPATCTACNGNASVTVTGGNPPYTYLWQPGNQTTQSISNLCAGNYTVTVTSGCITQSQTITVNSAGGNMNIATNNIQNVLCNSQCTGSSSINVTSGFPPYTYLWSNGNTTNTLTGLCAGVYTVVVTDNFGCTATHSITITQPTALNTTGSNTNLLCYLDSNATALVTASGGVGPYSYLWQPSNQTNSSATGLSAGNYTVTVTDNNGCTITQTYIITQPTPMLVNSGSTPAFCNMPTGTAWVTATGGNGPYTYLWNTSATTSTITGLNGGIYSVVVTDQNGCTVGQSILVPGSVMVTVNAAASTILCFGDCTGMITSNVITGSPPYTYVWSNSATTSSISNLCAGTYSVVVTDINGCTASVTNIVVTQPTQLTTTINATNSVICVGQTSTISINPSGGTGPYTYNWSPSGTGTSFITSPTATTIYSVIITDANGCTATAQIPVAVNQLPVILFSIDDSSGCAPLTVNFTNLTSNAGTCTWVINGNTFNTCNTSYTFTNPGSYGFTLTVIDNNGCTNTLTVNNIITVYPNPTASFYPTPPSTSILNPNILFNNTSTGGNTYFWSFGSTQFSPLWTFSDTGTYQVMLTVTNQYGCTATASDYIIIEPDQVIYAPNAFTPNEDQNNENFLVYGTGLDPDFFEMWIFDRWGMQIFYTQNLYGGWDGRVQNGASKQIVQEDVYVWRVKVKLYPNQWKTFIGHVSVIK